MIGAAASSVSPAADRDVTAVSDDVSSDVDPMEHSHFSWLQFIQQAPTQLLYPYSIMPAIIFFSPGFAANLTGLSRPASAGGIFGGVLFALMGGAPLITVVAWLLSSSSADLNFASTTQADVIHVVVLLLSFRIAITFKYAYMDRKTYVRRIKSWVSTEERSDEQLISGWQFIKPYLVKRHVKLSMAAQRWDVSFITVSLRDGALSRILSFLKCADARDVLIEAATADEKNGGIHVGALAEAIILSAAEEASAYGKLLFRASMMISVLSTVATAILRAALGLPALGYSRSDAVVVIAHWIGNLFVLGAVFAFLMIGAVDHFRRTRASYLLRHIFSKHSGPLGPMVELDSLQNVRAFMAVRGVLASFGAIYHERLVLVLSCNLVIYLLVAAYVVVTLFRAPSGALFMILCPFLLLHVLVAPAFLCIALGLKEAAFANIESRRLVGVVIEARLRLRFSELMQEQGIFDLLKDCQSDIKNDDEQRIKILGFDASIRMLQSFLGAWASLETICITLFMTKVFATASAST